MTGKDKIIKTVFFLSLAYFTGVMCHAFVLTIQIWMVADVKMRCYTAAEFFAAVVAVYGIHIFIWHRIKGQTK